MSLIKIIKRSRKEWKCNKCGNTISIGEAYRLVSPYKRPQQHICMKCKCRGWEFSNSEYVRECGVIVEDWTENYTDLKSAAEEIADRLQELADQAQESLDNLTEYNLQDGDSGQLLQERVDTLEDTISQLQDIDWDTVYEEKREEVLEEVYEDDFKDEDGNLDEDAYETEVDDLAHERTEEEINEKIEDALSCVEY